MATLSLFFGITIRMNREKGGKHKLPHIHAWYGGQQASFDIATGEIIVGSFDSDKATLVKSWIIIHREDLIANWELLNTEGQFFKIDPLK